MSSYVTTVLLFDIQKYSDLFFYITHRYTILPLYVHTCFLRVYRVYFILDYVPYTDFVNKFIVKFEISYYICNCAVQSADD